MIITEDGSVVLEPEETYIQTYVCYHDGRVHVFSPEEALDFMREQIYSHTRAPYLSRWQYDVSEPDDGWMPMSEPWEEAEDDAD